MTIVCAYQSSTQIAIGSDSLTNFGPAMSISSGSKWTNQGNWRDWWIGSSGFKRSKTLLAGYTKTLPKHPQDVADLIRTLHKNDAWQPDERKGEPLAYGSNFILANPSGLWYVDSSFCAYKWPARKLLAIGSGSEFARGAAVAATWLSQKRFPALYHSPLCKSLTPKEYIDLALVAAIGCDTCCGNPVFTHTFDLKS